MSPSGTIRVAVVTEFRAVAGGLACVLYPWRARVEVVTPLLPGDPVVEPVDVALVDTFGCPGVPTELIASLAADDRVGRVVVLSLNCEQREVDAALAAGAAGHLSKSMDGRALAGALLATTGEEPLVVGPTGAGRATRAHRGWPGQELGLSEREAEVAALAAVGYRNSQIADALCVSQDTVKTHLARTFRKLDVHNRTELSARVHRDGSFARLDAAAAAAR